MEMPESAAQVLATGTRLLVLVVGVVLLALAVFDLYWEWRQKHSLGYRFQRWGRRYPLYSLALLVAVGALLSHFFWQEFVAP
jgi:H+/Cl- antiporter ClcA